MSRRSLERVQHELKFRIATVRGSERLTPRMQRVTLHSPDFAGFVSPGYDDHVRLFFAQEGEELRMPIAGPNGLQFPDGVRPEGRDYTPRYFDPERNELVVDFVLHGDGPAANWAANAAPGSLVGVGGPRASFILHGDYDWYLLVGDETAIPAIGRRIEELRGRRVVAFIEIADAAEKDALNFQHDADIRWVQRHGLAPGHDDRLLHMLRLAELPEGEAYAFVAGEAAISKAVREHLTNERDFWPDNVKAAGYWRHGQQNFYDGHEH